MKTIHNADIIKMISIYSEHVCGCVCVCMCSAVNNTANVKAKQFIEMLKT